MFGQLIAVALIALFWYLPFVLSIALIIASIRSMLNNNRNVNSKEVFLIIIRVSIVYFGFPILFDFVLSNYVTPFISLFWFISSYIFDKYALFMVDGSAVGGTGGATGGT